MKILLYSYNTCCQNPSGGVQNRIRKIYELLRARGIQVDYFSPFETKVIDYDILHLFSLNAEAYDLVRFAHNRGVKVVLSPIVNVGGGGVLDFCRLFLNRLPFLTVRKMCFYIAHNTDLFITESSQEADFISKHYKIDNVKFKAVPNGIDTTYYDGKEIYNKIGGEKRFILQVGRFDNNKNQLNVIKALLEQNIDVVFIGGAAPTSEKYYKECLKLAGNRKHFHFLGWVDSKSNLLKSAYHCADIVILPSYHETFGLVALEGAISGAKLAISSTLPILEYPPFKEVVTFNPYSTDDICQAVMSLLDREKDTNLMIATASFFLWDNIIDQYIKCYGELL